MANYEKLYRTYQKRRDILYKQGKPLEEQLSLPMFAATYEGMKQQYKELGYKSPTKNIIQNLTRQEIAYDFSLKQARALRPLLEEKLGGKVALKDIRLYSFNEEYDVKQAVKDFNKALKEQGIVSSKERAKLIKNTFFYGNS